MSNQFVGEIQLVAYNFAPKGFAFCAGQLLPISQNTALFSLLGTFYGGDGKSTFALPNLQGQSAIGQGQGPGLTLYNVGDTGGSETVTWLHRGPGFDRSGKTQRLCQHSAAFHDLHGSLPGRRRKPSAQ
jgi:microcystin-dependent protein